MSDIKNKNKPKTTNFLSNLVEFFFRMHSENTCGSEKLIEASIKVSENIIIKPPALARLFFISKKIKILGYDCWVISPRSKKSTNSFMYIHGGGFILEITSFHWDFICRLIKKTNCTAYIPIYPLSKKGYSAINDDIRFLLEVYKEMLRNFSNNSISIIGDSAGGTLTLVVGQQIQKAKLLPPKNLICLSPLVKMSQDTCEIIQSSNKDAVLPYSLLSTVQKYILSNGVDCTDPIYSPINGSFENIGLVTIFIGTKEAFYDSNVELHNKLISLHIKHNFIVGEDMFHVWPLFIIPQSRNPFNFIVNLLK